MESIRQVLQILIDAAKQVASEADGCAGQTKELNMAIADMRVELEKANSALNERSEKLVIVTESGKISRILADHESDLSCIVVKYDIADVDVDQWYVVEVKWPETKIRQKVLIENARIEHEPEMVRAVVQANEVQRERAYRFLQKRES
jgi:hypothetical protein